MRFHFGQGEAEATRLVRKESTCSAATTWKAARSTLRGRKEPDDTDIKEIVPRSSLLSVFKVCAAEASLFSWREQVQR